MPYARLQYNGDNQYTTKDKRNLLLTQEAIDKLNGLTPSGGNDVVKVFEISDTSTPTELNEIVDFWRLNTSGKQETLPVVVYNNTGLKTFFYPLNPVATSKTVDNITYSGYAYTFTNAGNTLSIKDFGDQIPTEFSIAYADNNVFIPQDSSAFISNPTRGQMIIDYADNNALKIYINGARHVIAYT